MSLTPTQVCIVEAAGRDQADKMIAAALEISIDGVRSHWKAIFRKLGCCTRAGAVANYYRFRYLAQLDESRDTQQKR